MNIGLEAYFARPDTPMAGSPVGLAMQELLIMRPDLEADEARRLINETPKDPRGPKMWALASCKVGTDVPVIASELVVNRPRNDLQRAASQPSIQYAA